MNFSASADYHGGARYLQHRVVRDNIGKLTFRHEDSVLDVGCGTGEETKSMASKVRSVTGIDNSEKMLAFARENNSAPNITYSIGDAQTAADNPNWRETFDKAVSFCVLHWVPDKPKAFRSILDCLRPGGEALFIVLSNDTLYVDAAQFLSAHTKWADYVKGYKLAIQPLGPSVKDAEDLLKACGWTNVNCELDVPQVSSKVQTKLFWKTVLGQTALIPEAEQEAYLEDLWQWSLSRYADKSGTGGVMLPIEGMIIHAHKPLRSCSLISN